MTKHSLLTFLVMLFMGIIINGQNLPTLSDKAQVSVMTCAASNQLYTAFGHTAFRVQDPTIGLDLVYNYGTFNFNKPNFYINFAKGKLIYSLSRRRFEDFLYTYELERRWVKEQILNLNKEEVNQLFVFFENNYKPENRDYRYDPLFNNCSTIVSSILIDKFGEAIVYKNTKEKLWPFEWKDQTTVTFRKMVHSHINTNAWGTFGIDLAFGGITDREASLKQQMFLPYQAMYQLRNTTVNGLPIVKKERTVLDYDEQLPSSSFMTSPLFWFSFILLLILAITYLDWKHETRNRYLDFTLFFLSGLVGFGILLIWGATDHVVTHQNFNFLWLFPANAIVAFFLIKKDLKESWLKKYIWVSITGIALILVIWVTGIQILNPLNLLLMLMLLTRYLLLLQRT